MQLLRLQYKSPAEVLHLLSLYYRNKSQPGWSSKESPMFLETSKVQMPEHVAYVREVERTGGRADQEEWLRAIWEPFYVTPASLKLHHGPSTDASFLLLACFCPRKQFKLVS